MIGRRLDHLSAGCNQVLTVAAVIGREFALSALEHVGVRLTSPFVGDRLLEVLEEAEAARVITAVPRTPGRYSFAHALIRETLYEEQPTTRRGRLHRQGAEALEALYAQDPEPHLAELAHHFFQAGSTRSGTALGGDPSAEPVRFAGSGQAADKAIAYARRAAERATAVLAHEEAAGHYERALQAPELQDTPDEALRCELLLALGEAQARAGDVPAARESFRRAADLARKLSAPEQLARAALGFGGPRGVFDVGDAFLVSLLEEALDALGERDSALRARVLGRLVMERYHADSRERGAVLSQPTVAMARRVGDPAALAYALSARHAVIWAPEHLEERLAVATEIVRLAGEIGDRELALWGHSARLVDLLELGQIQAVDRELAAYARLAEESRQPFYRWQTAVVRAMRALLNGRFEETERLAEHALATGRRLQRENAVLLFLVQMFWVRREQGRLAELESRLEDLAGRYPWTAWPIVLAWLYADLGREAARSAFERLAANDFADLPRYGYWLNGLALLAETCARLGDARRAALLHELLLPYGERYIVSVTAAVCRGSARRYLGLLATAMTRWEEAAQHFEAALERNARIGARPWLAHTQHDYARMLLARDKPGDREKARELLRRAADTARELAMTRLAEEVLTLTGRGDRAHSAAAASGAHPRAKDGPDGLTRREVEVLRLLAEGRTNNEIAAELVVSVRTVEQHIANIYGKIGARRRVDATAYALRHGLVPSRALEI